jgi:hypothetical protein
VLLSTVFSKTKTKINVSRDDSQHYYYPCVYGYCDPMFSRLLRMSFAELVTFVPGPKIPVQGGRRSFQRLQLVD